ncbi:uncharacterized protein LOC134529371 isoform X3 [Bacillus rossius redtenbacheri]|uniref:uncharacterized protein LOC134529371 isoform X3 n=2 Tax=Bacillus rossius redtenbacheri TaxID=93214 RepID=UPI002FDE3744
MFSGAKYFIKNRKCELKQEPTWPPSHLLLNYLGEIRQFYLSFMYQVVEFDTDSGGGVGIIHSKWLTPRKKECFWPPFKHSQEYNKCLSDGQRPCEKWRICALKRKFYITDDILKAREKLKDAEFESDIATEYENESSQKRKKRPNRRILYSSDESSSDEYDTNNQLAHKKYPSPPDVEVAEVPVAECQRSVNTPSNSADSVFTRDSRPSRRSVINSESSSSILCSVENGNTVNTQDVTVSEDSTREQVGLQVIARHLAKIEKRLDVIQQSVSELLKQTLPDTVQNINILPEELTLPCETEEQLNKVEEWISIPENKICMETTLATVGGRKADHVVRHILERLFTNRLALKYNWTGKNQKIALKNLQLMKIIPGESKRIEYYFSCC